MLVKFLTGCALDVPRPEVREGRFNISVTYEQDGEGINIIGNRNGVYSDGPESDYHEENPDEAGKQGNENPQLIEEGTP